MTRRLITVIFAAFLFATTPAWARAQKAQEDKQPAADEKQKLLEKAILGLRDMLYGDKPLEEMLFFASDDDAVGPAVADVRAKEYAHALATLRGLKGRGLDGEDMNYWLTLAAAQRGAGNLEEARAAARRLLSSKETRIRIEAWSVLRELGESPPATQADEVQGVVVEMAFDEGVAIVAGYSDGAARFFSSRGGGVLAAVMPEPVQAAAKELTRTAAPLAKTLATGARQSLPSSGRIRVTVLTPAGGRVAEEEMNRVEPASHRLHAAYVAAYRLLVELQKVYKAK